jgi:hypothetical protein
MIQKRTRMFHITMRFMDAYLDNCAEPYFSLLHFFLSLL